jgi:hypothetical protein
MVRAVTVLLNDSRYGPRQSNCWLLASTWADALNKSGHIDASLVSTDARKFRMMPCQNLASNSCGESVPCFDGTNQTGVFWGKYTRQSFYYFTEKQRQMLYPAPINNTWKDLVLQAAVTPSTWVRPAISSTNLQHDNSNISEDKMNCQTNIGG